MALELPRCPFSIGQKVVCIDDDFGSYSIGEYTVPVRHPMISEVLTVKHLYAVGDRIFVFFYEIDEVQISGPLRKRIAWEHVCFRPLITRKTDISQFKALLNPESAKEFVWAD